MAFLDFATANGIPVPGGTAHEPSTRPHKEAGTESSGEPSVFSRLAIALGTTLTLGLTGGHTATDSDETLVGGNRDVSKASTGRFNQPSADDLYFSHVGGRSKRIQPPPRIPAPPCISPAKGACHSERAMSTLFGELPSAALAGDNFSVDYIKAFGQGGMSLTFLGRIIFPSRKEKGDFVFIKKLLRKDLRVRKNYSELRAYERLASASGTTEHSKYLKFVAGLQAFICRPKSLSYMLLFNLHACDLWAALFAEPVRFPVRDMGSHLYKWLAQIASGIHGLHGVGIIHRDLKPENVLIDWNYDARITDLGLAFVTETQQALDYTKSYCSQFCGTIDFMAPEVRAIGESFERDQVKAWREE
ncbi:hypothetical protein NMY22_g15546 [Coprinellus aureogranulatus]|nr:hypothetical protein NMY22_g15546 [Coprinellus aureogranulatus]